MAEEYTSESTSLIHQSIRRGNRITRDPAIDVESFGPLRLHPAFPPAPLAPFF